MTYPGREKFFSHRFTRLLAKCCVANDISALGCWMLTIIVQTEDASHYRRGVTFYDGQLMPLMGIHSKKTMTLARRKAIASGWLHFEPGHKGKASTYWVLIPAHAEGIDDLPTDEGEEELVVNNTPNSEMGSKKGTELGIHREPQRAQIVSPYNPNPNPKVCVLGEDGFERPDSPYEKPPIAPGNSLARFPDTIQVQARALLTDWYFWRYGRLPNLSSDSTESNLATLAGVVEAFGESVGTKLKEFMTRPPPGFPRTSPLWKIFRYLGLEAPSDEPRRANQKSSHGSNQRHFVPGGDSYGDAEKDYGSRVKTIRIDQGTTSPPHRPGDGQSFVPPSESA